MIQHRPTGPLCACGAPASAHRKPRGKRVSAPEHAPTGDPCTRCGQPAAKHRIRAGAKGPKAFYPIGIDGEGNGRSPHRYTYLAAGDEHGQTWEVYNREGLRTVQCLDLMLSLPERATITGFAFNYDLTKILADLPDGALFKLFHEQTRYKTLPNGRTVFKPVRWEGYKLNYMNRRFTVERDGQKRVIWDIFKFFQCAFVKALTDWSIATPEQLTRMSAMKAGRDGFSDEQQEEINAYCKEECAYLARLFGSLYDAHIRAGLPLKDFFGAGSTSSALLKRMNVRRCMQAPPEPMHDAITRAFFGGRFENRVIGPVEGPVYNYDINSAYPYHTTFLPCLVHGEWYHQARGVSFRDIAHASAALVRYEVEGNGPWGAFPCRTVEGNMVFPLNGQGWTWGAEYLAARKIASVDNSEAWLYYTECDCKPFAELPWFYLERLKLGADGMGIVFKLGPNGCYGKLAQSVGKKPPFQSFVWASIITSNTRAQLLDAIATDPEAVIMVATDGIFSTRELALAAPKDTGTGHVEKGALGAWGRGKTHAGMFAARPGIYFPMNPTPEQLKEVRARGLGKAVIRERWKEIVDAFAAGHDSITLDGLTQFIGVKDAVNKRGDGSYSRSPLYGEWVKRSVRVSFDPRPKREPDMGPIVYAGESVPYSRAVASLAMARDELNQEDY